MKGNEVIHTNGKCILHIIRKDQERLGDSIMMFAYAKKNGFVPRVYSEDCTAAQVGDLFGMDYIVDPKDPHSIVIDLQDLDVPLPDIPEENMTPVELPDEPYYTTQSDPVTAEYIWRGYDNVMPQFPGWDIGGRKYTLAEKAYIAYHSKGHRGPDSGCAWLSLACGVHTRVYYNCTERKLEEANVFHHHISKWLEHLGAKRIFYGDWREKVKMVIKESEYHGKGVFAGRDYKAGEEWVFELEEVCCQAHCFSRGADGFRGTKDWPFYINSCWPDTHLRNIQQTYTENSTITIKTKRDIKKGEELLLAYDWTRHDPCPHEED